LRKRNCPDKDQYKYASGYVGGTERRMLRREAMRGGLLEKRPAARTSVLEAEPPDHG
jgi:hypothetical protein